MMLVQRGEKLFLDDKEVGYLTSAMFSPSRQKTLALGYVRKECNQPGQILRRSPGLGGGAVEVEELTKM